MFYTKPQIITFIVERPDSSQSLHRFTTTDLDKRVFDLLKEHRRPTKGREFWIAVLKDNFYTHDGIYTKVNDRTTALVAHDLTYQLSRTFTPLDVYVVPREEDIPSFVYIIDQVEGYAPDFWFDPKPADRNIIKTKGLPPSPLENKKIIII